MTSDDTDLDVSITKRPPEDADEWDLAMTLAENLAQSDHIGERQAQVYAAADVYGFDNAEILEKLEMTESNVYSTLYDARANIEDSQWIQQVTKEPPKEPRQITDPIPVDEWSSHYDRFETERRHDVDEDLTGALFQYDADDPAEPIAVKVVQQTGTVTDEGAPAYVIQQLLLDGTVGERYVAPVDWVVDAIEDGRLQRARLSLDVE